MSMENTLSASTKSSNFTWSMSPARRVHGGFGKLVRVHFSKPLVALDGDVFLVFPFVNQFLLFLVGKQILLLLARLTR